ncbi:hypothetical protein ACCO45_011929 [Purpureocillium lilacinum]|uniref:Uncharacterized protein n=1 Tax=Purpureocillium lilacinum TaxID=33203 RepID=A0ACC4DD67_PURLI
MQAKLVLLSALAASVSATVDFHAAVAACEAPAALAPRQTVDAECQSAVLSAGSSIPTPPPRWSPPSATTSRRTPAASRRPPPLSKEFASYSSQLESWASKNKDILTKCSALADLNTISVTSCDKKGGASTKATGAGASSTNGVARETGMAVAAMAAAGIAAIAL